MESATSPRSPVSSTPRSDDCVGVLVFQGRLINRSIDSPFEPQLAPSSDHSQLIRVRIQTRWRATSTATILIRKRIDIRDLLVQNAISLHSNCRSALEPW